MGQMSYMGANIPEDKNPKKYTFVERRAEILALMIKAGSPRFSTQEKLAKRYGVSQKQISLDMEILQEYLLKTSQKRAKEKTALFYETMIDRAMESNDISNARQLVKDWNDWLFRTGAQEESAKKLSIEHSGLEAMLERLRETNETQNRS